MNDQLTVLVTGSDGFVGRHLVPYLSTKGYNVVAASRTPSASDGSNLVVTELPDLSAPFDWTPLLQICNAVVHLAGIAHNFADEKLYDRVNHQATERLAQAAFRCGTHLVFVSSISAQCGSFSEYELSENNSARPDNMYGRSKLAAELIIRNSSASFTILRPVVMYGAGEKGNFETLHKISRLPIPLPFGNLTAKRSVLSIRNFCSAVELALTNSRARGETLIVSDSEPVSVSELIEQYRAEMGRPRGLIPVPEKWLEFFLKAIGRNAIWQRIGCPLVARPTKTARVGLETILNQPCSNTAILIREPHEIIVRKS